MGAALRPPIPSLTLCLDQSESSQRARRARNLKLTSSELNACGRSDRTTGEKMNASILLEAVVMVAITAPAYSSSARRS